MSLTIRRVLTTKAFFRLRELFSNAVVRAVNKLRAEHNLPDITLSMIVENLNHFEFKMTFDELNTDAYVAIVFWVLPVVEEKLISDDVPSGVVQNFVSAVTADVARHQFSSESEIWYQKQIKQLSIQWLDLTNRTRDALKRARITSIADLVVFSPADLVREHDFPRQRLPEIERALKQAGFSWSRRTTR